MTESRGIRVTYGTRIVKNCAYCGKELLLTAGHVTLNNYCSMSCSGMARSRAMKGKFCGSDSPYWKGRIDKSCETCGKPMKVEPWEVRRGNGKYCSRKCLYIAQGKLHGRNSPHFKTGIVKVGGYRLITNENYVGDGPGRYIREHRHVMERTIGRKLSKNECIHHRNGIRDDNRIENLEIVIKKAHYGRVLCPYCKKTFSIK